MRQDWRKEVLWISIGPDIINIPEKRTKGTTVSCEHAIFYSTPFGSHEVYSETDTSYLVRSTYTLSTMEQRTETEAIASHVLDHHFTYRPSMTERAAGRISSELGTPTSEHYCHHCYCSSACCSLICSSCCLRLCAWPFSTARTSSVIKAVRATTANLSKNYTY